MGKKKRARFEASLARVNPERYTGHALADLAKFSADQPRDDHGRFAGGGAGGGSAEFRYPSGKTYSEAESLPNDRPPDATIATGVTDGTWPSHLALWYVDPKTGDEASGPNAHTYVGTIGETENADAVFANGYLTPEQALQDYKAEAAHYGDNGPAPAPTAKDGPSAPSKGWAPMSAGDREAFAGAEDFPNGDPPHQREVTVEGADAVAILDAHGGQVILDDEKGNTYAWDATDPGAVAWMASHPGNFSAGEFARAGMDQILGDDLT